MRLLEHKRWQLAQDYEKRHWQKQASAARREGRGVDWYDWNAKQIVKFVTPFLHDVPPKVLEIGSGPVGSISYIPWGERYAIDPLEDYYASHPELIKHRDNAVHYYLGAGENLPFESGTFALVICENVLDHTESPAKVLSEIRRVLSKDSLLYFSVNIHTILGVFLHKLLEFVHADKGHPHSYSLDSIRKTLNTSGYSILKEACDDYRKVKAANLASKSLRQRIKGLTGLSEMHYRAVCNSTI